MTRHDYAKIVEMTKEINDLSLKIEALTQELESRVQPEIEDEVPGGDGIVFDINECGCCPGCCCCCDCCDDEEEGPAIVAFVYGCPPGFDIEDILKELV